MSVHSTSVLCLRMDMKEEHTTLNNQNTLASSLAELSILLAITFTLPNTKSQEELS